CFAGMMGGGAFILLNVSCGRRETAQQAEICLAGLLTILRIIRTKRRNYLIFLVMVVLRHNFCGICLIPGNRSFCYPDHSVSAEISAVSPLDGQDKDKRSTGVIFYT
ncbi:MAG: hypothetical protein P4M02_04645, partial [Clostridia bacterium]|nr:hypothetical protein [Clostridia bacterium]